MLLLLRGGVQLHFWGRFHFWGHLHFWGCLHFWGYLDFLDRLHFWGRLYCGVRKIFQTVSIFFFFFIFSLIKNSWVWHCSAKLENLSVLLLSQAPALLVIMSWMSVRPEPLPKTRDLTNLKPRKLDTEWNTERINI